MRVEAADLILCSATLLEDATHPGSDALAIQVDAAKAAGFGGISLWSLFEAVARKAGPSAEAIREGVLGSGLRVPIVEALLPWDAVDGDAALRSAAPTLALARAYGAEHVVAVAMRPELQPIGEAAARLRALCERAADSGLKIAVEFLPWTGIPDLRTALRLVEASDCDNLGILLDAWHWQRQPGGPCPELLRRVPPERLTIFQLCDAAAEARGEPLEECMTRRALPGEGVVDLPGLVGVLDEIGARPLVAPEVFHRELARGGALAMAQRVRDASLRLLSV